TPAARLGQTNRGTDLGLRQVGEREWHQDYFPGCRCDHAASSSGRDQSTARAASASSVASPGTAAGSSNTVTKARRGPVIWTVPSNWTWPAASTTASTVWIIGHLPYHCNEPRRPNLGPAAWARHACPKVYPMLMLRLI